VLDDDVRRCLVRGSPYVVRFAVEPESTLIVAVMHGTREHGNY
jgi:plasmid stabilization system protein ParE